MSRSSHSSEKSCPVDCNDFNFGGLCKHVYPESNTNDAYKKELKTMNPIQQLIQTKKEESKKQFSPCWGEENEKFIESLVLETAKLVVEKERKSKDEAYRERNMLVCALTKLFPAYLARHDENDMGWDRDWMWIVYIELPTGQVSWHLHDSEVQMFSHLKVQENKWDGHNTERKYERLSALSQLDNVTT